MRFKPRIVNPEKSPLDDDGQLQLPEDLHRLGQQLVRDAKQLAETYPPTSIDVAPVSLPDHETTSPPMVSAVGRKPRRRRPSWRPALQVAAAALILGVIWQQLGNHSTDVPSNARPTQLARQNPVGQDETAVNTRAPWAWLAWTNRIVPWNHWGRPPVVPRLDQVPFLHEITGPELEGILDLWELQPVSEAMVAL